MTTHLREPAALKAITGAANVSGRECWYWAGWEPDRFYQRIGARATRYFGNGDWIADWRVTLEGDACLDSLEAVGGSPLITRFYKGFGPAVERKAWGSLSQFVKSAQMRGLKVWGYLQGQSIFGEFLFNEFPEARDWIARSYDGAPLKWGGAYNRFAPCLTSEGFLAMMESLVEEGLSQINLDGLHLDNCYYQHCYCDRCKGLFRQWLSDRGDLEEITGIERATYVEPPPLTAETDIVPDPLSILWIEFGVRQRMKFMMAIRRKVELVKPGAVLTGNPAFMRSFASRLTHGFDPTLEAAALDSVCVENGNRPRFSNGVLHTQADKHLVAEAASLRTWVTSWAPPRSGSGGHEAPMDAQSIWAGLGEEFSFWNAYLGNNWALRSEGDGGRLLEEALPEQREIFQRALRYFQRLEGVLGSGRRGQSAEVVLYLDTRSLSLCPSSDAHVVQALIARLLLKRVSFKILFQDQPVPEETHTILIAGQRCLNASEFTRLAANRSKEIWLLGECGSLDEWAVPRGSTNRRTLLDRPNVRSFPLPLNQWLERGASSKKYFQGTTPSFTPEGAERVDAVLKELARRQKVQVQAPDGVLANIETMDDGRLLVHVRDLRDDENAVNEDAVCITLSKPASNVVGYSDGWDSGFSLSGEAVISLPRFKHYACVLIAF